MEIKKNEDRKRICVTVRVNPHVPGPRNPENLELDFVLQINSGPLLSAVITQAPQWCEEFHLEKVGRWPERWKDILELELQ